MENNSNRRLLFAIGFVLFFAVVVIIWFFFYAKPVIVGTKITETNNPLPVQELPPRFQFFNWGGAETSTTTTEIIDPLLNPLVKVWDKPATGQTFITQNILKEIVSTSTIGTTTIETRRTIRATSTVLVFVDRITGYIYGYPIETGKPFQITNTIIPGIYDAYIFDDGKRVLMRYLDQDNNKIIGMLATIPNVQEGELTLSLQNIQYISSPVTSVAINLKKDKISYLIPTPSGSAMYSVTSKGQTLVANSSFKEWTLSYGGEQLYATTKPSAYVLGATFSVPSFQPESTSRTGLMTNPGPGGVFINSMWSDKGLVTFISNKSSTNILSSPTLAKKCVWGERRLIVCAIPKSLPRVVEGLPDDWFQGRVSFDDDIFIVDEKTGDKYPLYVFKNEDGVFDIVNISLSQENTFISFNKKMDFSLWFLNTNLIGGNGEEN